MSLEKNSKNIFFLILVIAFIILTTISVIQSIENHRLEVGILNEQIKNKRLSEEITELLEQNTNLTSQIEILESAQLRNPSMNELQNFMEDDKTNEYLFSSVTFNCQDYAVDLKKNANSHGLNMSFVLASYTVIIGGRRYEAAHTFNGVTISDNGRKVFIEPQTDVLYNSAEELIEDRYEGKVYKIVEVW